MHLPNHYLDPTTCAVTALLSGGAVAYSLVRMRRDPAMPKVLTTAGVSAAIFAAQMFNFPVAPGTSGHLVGGALAGLLLGPWTGLLAMTAVLVVQAVVFGDGGVLALGANVLNMGVIGVAVGTIADRLIPADFPKLSRSLVAALAGWLSVVAASVACALEMAASGTAAANEVVPAMFGVHALIGLGEAAITGFVVAAVRYGFSPLPMGKRRGEGALATRFATLRSSKQHFGRASTGLLLIAIIVVALTPFASSLPDGLDRVATGLRSLQLHDVSSPASLLSSFTFSGIPWTPAATLLTGFIGVGLVYGLAAYGCVALRDTRSKQ